MNRKLCLIVTTTLLVLIMATPGYCADPIPWGQTDIHPQLSRQLPYDLVYRGADRGGVSTIVSQVSKLTATHLAFSILKLAGATKTFTLGAGTPGKEITLVKMENDARVLKLAFNIDNPDTTHTGFTSVTWPTVAGGFVTLAWIDNDIGWIITGAEGVTIAY